MNKFDKRVIVILCITLALIGSVIFLKVPAGFIEMDMVLTLDLEESDSLSSTLYADYGTGYSEEDAFYVDISGGKAVFHLSEESINNLEQIKEIRIDPINRKGSFAVREVSFYRNNIKIGKIGAEEFFKCIDNTINVESTEQEETEMVLSAATEDPQLYMSSNFNQYIVTFANEYKIHKAIIIFIIMILAVATIFISSIIHFITKTIRKIEAAFESNSRLCNIIFFAILGSIVLALYWGYITGSKYYIFIDTATDSYYQTYPNLFRLATNIEDGRWNEMWSFLDGIGKRINIGDFNITNWICLFGTELIPYLIGVNQVLKVLLSGIIFYFYMRLMGKSYFISTVCAISYAFCGHMIIRGTWYNYPNEVLLFALWLLCFELYNKKGNFKLLPLATALLFNALNGYYVLLYLGIFTVYSIFRYSLDNEFWEKETFYFFLKFAGCILAGTLLVSIFALSGISSSINSNRFDSSFNNLLSGLNDGIFSSANFRLLYAAFFRTIGMDIIGISQDYVGIGDFLSDGTFYCGILTLIVLPQGIWSAEKKKKIWYILGCTAAALIIFTPLFRTLINALQPRTFKLGTFWITVFMLLIAADALETVFEKKRLNRGLILGTAGGYIVVTVMFLSLHVNEIRYARLFLSLAIMLIWLGVILYWIYGRRSGRLAVRFTCLVLLTAEIILVCFNPINDRQAVTKEYLAERRRYNDYTAEALEYIRSIDDSRFYRIDKQYNSVFLCDALVQEYYGTKTYLGGTGVSREYSNFTAQYNLPVHFNAAGFITGYKNINEVNTITGVKYILSADEHISDYGYDLINKVKGINIYLNQYYMPLAVAYPSYVETKQLDPLGVQAKRELMLESAVIDKNIISVKKNPDIASIEDREKRMFDKYEVDISKEGKDTYSFAASGEDDVVVVKLKKTEMKSSGKDRYIHFYDATGENIINSNLVTFDREIADYQYIAANNKIGKISLELGKNDKIKDVRVSVIPAKEYFERYENNAEKLRNSPVEIDSFSNTVITGKVSCDEDSILSFSIPYDIGWRLYLDGEQVETMTTNITFLGAELPAGEHSFRLSYKYPGMNKYIAMTISGIILYGILLVWGIRKSKN